MTVTLYEQEKDAATSGLARMNSPSTETLPLQIVQQEGDLFHDVVKDPDSGEIRASVRSV